MVVPVVLHPFLCPCPSPTGGALLPSVKNSTAWWACGSLHMYAEIIRWWLSCMSIGCFCMYFSEYLGSFSRKTGCMVAEASGSSPSLQLEVRMSPPLHLCFFLTLLEISGLPCQPQARWQFSSQALRFLGGESR